MFNSRGGGGVGEWYIHNVFPSRGRGARGCQYIVSILVTCVGEGGQAGFRKGRRGWERFLSFSFCFRAALRVQRFNAVFRLLVPYQPTSIDEGGVAQMALQHPNVPVGVSMRLQTV